MMKDFKEFMMRGNVVDLAVGVIIGGAFGAIVSSLVADVIMPPIGLLTSGINFADLFVALDGKTYATLADATKAGAPVIAYGKFINSVINFIIVGFAIFMMIKQVNRFNKPAPPPPAPPTKDCPACTSSIPAAAKRCPHCTEVLAKGATA